MPEVDDAESDCASGQFEVISTSPDQTLQLGTALGKLLMGGDIVCLSGDLGAGKTALTVGIGRGWGAREIVNSPTFVFVHEHHRSRDDERLFHLDCYRLTSDEDAISIGLEDMLAGQDVVIIEWPERVQSFLPDDHLWIALEALEDETTRRLVFTARGQRYCDLLDELRGALDTSLAL